MFCFVFFGTYKGSPRGAEGNFPRTSFPLVAALLGEKQQEQDFTLLYWVQRNGRMEGRRQVDKLSVTRKLKSLDELCEDKDTMPQI